MANPDIQLCDLASLNWVSHRVPNSPAELYGHAQEHNCWHVSVGVAAVLVVVHNIM